MLKGSTNIVAGIILVITLIFAVISYFLTTSEMAFTVVIVIGALVAASPRMVLEWEQGILLRLGKFHSVIQPGITWIIPGIDVIMSLVDMRIRTTTFCAEKALTKDTVPVNVDAVLFWLATDAKRAVLEVEYYAEAVNWLAQTTLRDVIGSSELVQMISDREKLDKDLQTIIDAKTSEWGITVQSVEIRDVNIPASLEDAMSRKAQADREKEARIILSQSEFEVANQMAKASQVYEKDSISMQLRMMNMTYESVKEKGALMVIPSSMAESLSGQVMGIASAGFRYCEPDKEMNI